MLSYAFNDHQICTKTPLIGIGRYMHIPFLRFKYIQRYSKTKNYINSFFSSSLSFTFPICYVVFLLFLLTIKKANAFVACAPADKQNEKKVREKKQLMLLSRPWHRNPRSTRQHPQYRPVHHSHSPATLSARFRHPAGRMMTARCKARQRERNRRRSFWKL
jgi:hypothetical protein